MSRVSTVAVVLSLLLVACPSPSSGPGELPGPDAPAPAAEDGAARAPDAARTPAPESPPEPEEPPPEAHGACALGGGTASLPQVVDADLSATDRTTLATALVEEAGEPLAMSDEGRPFPPARALYLLRPEAEHGFALTSLLSDPGPFRDPFGRIAYERVALGRIACRSDACLVAAAVERQTPGTETSAFTVAVVLLDATGRAQGPPRWLAQEPDRGEALEACLGAASDGFLLATAVRGGRGRLMWLDRQGTPMDVRFVQGGFESCSTRSAGSRVQVATVSEAGVQLAELGGASAEPEPEPEPEPAPQLSPAAGAGTAAALATLGGEPVLLVARGSSMVASSPGGGEELAVFGAAPTSSAAASVGDDVLAVAVVSGRLAAARLAPGPALGARSTGLAPASRAWVVRSERGPAPVGWLDEGTFRLRSLACEPDEAEAPGEERTVSADDLRRTEAASAGRLRDQARQLAARHPYRAAWLLERAFSADPSDPTALRDAAALLSGVRYTQAGRRVLRRLAALGTDQARSLLRSTCRDPSFERQWRLGEYQQITGCSGSTGRGRDAGASASEPEQG